MNQPIYLHAKRKTQNGFTLLELSMVLVVIGLIIGGIMVGKDLIKTSEIRAQLKQFEDYNSAANAFRLKYNGLPGDILRTTTTSAGLFTMTKPGTADPSCNCWGDGNGFIEAEADSGTSIWNGVYQKAAATGETMVFWRHLSDTNMISGKFGALLSVGGHVPSDITGSAIGNYLPLARYGNSNYLFVTAAVGKNWFLLTGVTQLTQLMNGGAIYGSYNIVPIDAYNMDLKIDDGVYSTGNVKVISKGGTNFNTYNIGTPNSIPASCITAPDYNLTATDPGCIMVVKTQF